MKVYIVARTIEGYAKEDPLKADVISVHEDHYAAETVKRVAGGTARVFEVELNTVPSGIRDDAMNLFNVVI